MSFCIVELNGFYIGCYVNKIECKKLLNKITFSVCFCQGKPK